MEETALPTNVIGLATSPIPITVFTRMVAEDFLALNKHHLPNSPLTRIAILFGVQMGKVCFPGFGLSAYRIIGLTIGRNSKHKKDCQSKLKLHTGVGFE